MIRTHTSYKTTATAITRIGLGIVLLFLAFPIVVVFTISMGADNSTSFPPTAFSVQRYIALFSEREWFGALIQSFEISLISTIFSVVCGLLASAAILDLRPRSALSGISFTLLTMPLFVPAIVLGIGLSRVTSALHLPDILAMALSLSVITTPVVMICTLVALQGVDAQLKNAASSLGSNAVTTFFLITLPLIRRGLAIGAFISFLIAFDELVISLFVATPDIQTLPIKFWSALRFYTSPFVAPVSTIMFLAMFTILSILFLYGRKNDH